MIDKSKENIKTLIGFIFVLSGSAGLIYQIVWFKYLGLFLGNSTLAQTTVLATFLAGLALGNSIFGKLTGKFKNQIRIYAFIELFIGIYCLFYPALNTFVGDTFLNFSATNLLNPESTLFNLLRLLVSAILLLPPTIAMGGTLPVLSQYFIERLENARRETAILYYLNSFGAIVGIFIGGFFLIRAVGLEAAIFSAAAVNLFAGTSAIVISKKIQTSTTQQQTATQPLEEENTRSIKDSSNVKIVLLVAGLSGIASLMYENLWTRLLINFIGSSTYAFSIMLMAFISGITIGAWITSQKFFGHFDKIRVLFYLQVAIALFTFVALIIFDRLPYYLWKISYLFSKTEEAFSLFLTAEFFFCFSLISIPTIFMGMTLPVAVEIVSSLNKKIGLSVGTVFSINTFGNVLGVLISGLILIPAIGLSGSFKVGIAINILSGLLILLGTASFQSKEKIFSAVIVVLLFGLFSFSFGSFNKDLMLGGIFRSLNEKPPTTYVEFLKRFDGEKILYYKEGSAATVAVTQWHNNNANKSLIINGKPDGSTFYDMPTQVLLGQIPMMLHKNPKNIFVVGFGTGTTIGSVLTHPIEEVVCAEISKEVIEAGKYFTDVNYNCASDERLKLINEDAATLLKIQNKKFDVIISEPSNPWIAGIGNLFSKEYFERCTEKLNEDGIMVQWFHLYESNDDVVKMVINTFASVFKFSTAWSAAANDIILVGSQKDISINTKTLIHKFNSKKIKDDFARINIYSPFEFLCNQISSAKNFFIMADKNPINTEIKPRLEFLAPKSFYVGGLSNYVFKFDERLDTTGGILLKEFIKKQTPSEKNLLSAARFSFNISKNYRLAFALSKYILEKNPKNFSASNIYISSYEKINFQKTSLASLEERLRLFPDSVGVQREINNYLLSQKINSSSFLKIYSIAEEANNFIKMAGKDTLSNLKTYIQLTHAFYINGEYGFAREMKNRAEQIIEDSTNIIKKLKADDFYYSSAMLSIIDGNDKDTFKYYLALLNTNPNYVEMHTLRRNVSWYLSKRKFYKSN